MGLSHLPLQGLCLDPTPTSKAPGAGRVLAPAWGWRWLGTVALSKVPGSFMQRHPFLCLFCNVRSGEDQYPTSSLFPVELLYPNTVFNQNVKMHTVEITVKFLQPKCSAGCLHRWGWLGLILRGTPHLPETSSRASCLAGAACRAVSAKLKKPHPGINAAFPYECEQICFIFFCYFNYNLSLTWSNTCGMCDE